MGGGGREGGIPLGGTEKHKGQAWLCTLVRSVHLSFQTRGTSKPDVEVEVRGSQISHPRM